MLSSWNVPFTAIDTEVQPAAMQELQRFGISRVPAVVMGDRAVHGWNPQGVAELVGVAYDEDTRLAPDELSRRLDAIMVATQRAMRQVPIAHLGMKTPGRDRTVRQLGFHVFRVALSYKDAMVEGFLPEHWFGESPPAEMRDGAAIAAYGQTVRERLADWLQRPEAHAGMVNTYYGPQTAHAFFERTVWHTAQHLRQLYALFACMEVTPDNPLPQEAFHGLPLPDNVW